MQARERVSPIKGTGSLRVVGGEHGSGIGGDGIHGDRCGKIVVNGGTLIAEGNGGGNGLGMMYGGFEQNGGTVIALGGAAGHGAVVADGKFVINGGNFTARGGADMADVMLFMLFNTESDVAAEITGGSVNVGSFAYNEPYNAGVTSAVVPTNGTEELSRVDTGLEDAGEGVPVTAIGMENVDDYGIKDMKTDKDGKIYVWVPADGELVSAGTKLMDYECSLFGGEQGILTKVAASYKVIKGALGEWNGDKTGLGFTSDGAFARFTGIEVDGKKVSTENYTAVSGSTVVTLKADYLKTLAVGKHTLNIVYTDGAVKTEFSVAAVPATGDAGFLFIGAALLVSCAGIAYFAVKAKKHRG